MNFNEWYNNTLSDEHTPEKLRAAEHGWNACKQEVLKIITKDWIGCDLSINSCDEYYIEKIEKL